jgi:hypothetical protein
VFHTHVSSCFVRMLQVFYLDVSKVDLVLQLMCSDVSFMCFICFQTYVASVVFKCFKSRSGVASLSSLFYYPTFASVSPPPLSASWASAASSPLLDAGAATCCSHLLQLLAACIRVRSGGDASRDSPCVVGRCGPHIGRHGCKCAGRQSVGMASIRTSGC